MLSRQKSRLSIGNFLLIVSLFCGLTGSGLAQFSSGSTGVDGALNITAPGVTNFTQIPVAGGNIYNFTTINVAGGSTLRLSGATFSYPLYFLAQGAVTINGNIDLSGGDGTPAGSTAQRVPSTPGAGGYSGGLPGFGPAPAQPGNGPAGGTNNHSCAFGYIAGGGGGFSANQFLVPLLGGSGGGAYISAGGGAGGGALLIASSLSLTLTGTINANGGNGAGNGPNNGPTAGGGAGGAVRLVANSIGGGGTITVRAGSGSCGNGVGAASSGFVRLETFQNSLNINVLGPVSNTTPFGLFLPTNSPPSLQVISIGGVPVPPNPTGMFSVPDVVVNSAAPLPVQIAAQNIPVGTTVSVFFLSENGPDISLTTTLAGTLASSSASTLVTLPAGYSRGWIKATWTQ